MLFVFVLLVPNGTKFSTHFLGIHLFYKLNRNYEIVQNMKFKVTKTNIELIGVILLGLIN